jgi:pyridoxal phosphate enzyme (YggS family)
VAVDPVAVAANVAGVRERVAAAAARAGRDPGRVTLVAVAKLFPAAAVRAVVEAGVVDVGENYAKDLERKAAEVPGARWHFVGRLQRNKARSVAGWAGIVQSVESVRLADALHTTVAAALDDGRREEPLDVLVQVSLDDNPGRGGCPVPQLPALAEHVASLAALRLRGVMAVAPLGEDPEVAFARLESAAAALREQHPQATELSAGMTGDLEAAIRHGSTCVRVGTALLGQRPLA